MAPDSPRPASDPQALNVMLPTLIIAVALFMETMEATAVATALPRMAVDFHESPVVLKLALTVYMIGLAIFIPVSPWLADRFGTRTVFRTAIALFLLGSLGCALAPTLEALVSARFIQAIGGAMMVPVGRLVLLKIVPKDKIVTALSRLAMPAMLGPVFGPVIGGLITTHGHWRLIFLVNVPAAMMAWWLAGRHIPQVRAAKVPPLDVRGFALCSIGLGTLSLGLASLGQSLLAPSVIWALCAAGVVALGAYALHAARAAQPLLDLRLLRIPTMASGVIGGSFFRLGIGAAPFLLSLMFQLVMGLDAAQTGWLLMSSAVGAFSMKIVTTRVLRRYGFRTVLFWNGLLAVLSMAACSWIGIATSWPVIVVVLLAGGLFRSMQFTALHSISYADVPHAQIGSATALASAAQQLSLSLGVTLGAQALMLSAVWGARTIPALQDFQFAFMVVAACTALSLWWPWRLPEGAGAELARQRKTEAAS